MSDLPLRHIAIGVIRNRDNEIFITKRCADVHLGGYWEFPGGKVEQNETPIAALHRELAEEVGIQVTSHHDFMVIENVLDDRILMLHVFIVDGWQGEPKGNEGQPARWVAQSQLQLSDFPEVNGQIIAKLNAV